MAINQTSTISAANTFTTPIYLIGWFNVSVYFTGGAVGPTSSTITVQRSFDKGTTWLDVQQYTTTIEQYGFEPEGATYRVGIKAAQYGGTPVTVRLGTEPGMTH
jgi:hypothetical protein